jgi:hypothetical protein
MKIVVHFLHSFIRSIQLTAPHPMFRPRTDDVYRPTTTYRRRSPASPPTDDVYRHTTTHQRRSPAPPPINDAYRLTPSPNNLPMTSRGQQHDRDPATMTTRTSTTSDPHLNNDRHAKTTPMTPPPQPPP